MEPVNLFFSCDDNYVPFLSVALTSIQENRDQARHYCVRILHTGLKREHQKKLESSLTCENFEILFCDLGAQVREFSRRFHTRDYYSQSTYYRLFIPELFPELSKALYLDCDIVVLGDISQLYDTEMGGNLVGAVPDGAVAAIEPFKLYVRNRLQVEPSCYFNAGILLMNLEAMRCSHFQDTFLSLLDAVTFQVAQDQDYLNTICRDRAIYLGKEWNTMPGGTAVTAPKLIHYNLDCKPWHSDQVPYQEYFWEYADRSPYAQIIRQIRSAYTEADTRRSQEETVHLIALATRQALDEDENVRIHEEIAKVVGL